MKCEEEKWMLGEELERYQMVQARDDSGLDLNWPHVGRCFECKVNRTCLQARYGRRGKGKNPG